MRIVKEFYLGVAGDKRKSFRDGKHYKRSQTLARLGDDAEVIGPR